MSIMGTGTAAAVAQTALVSQQQGRRADKTRGERQRTAADAAVAFVKKLHGPAEAGEPGAELPDRQALGYEQLYGPDGSLPPATVEDAGTAVAGGAAAAAPHLDVTG